MTSINKLQKKKLRKKKKKKKRLHPSCSSMLLHPRCRVPLRGQNTVPSYAAEGGASEFCMCIWLNGFS